MSEENLPLPLEIPWKLASTTQALATGEPDQTSISFFVFEPDNEKLTSQFPNERLIYLKFTVSVSPASIPSAPPVSALGEGVPCFHLLLDLKVRKADGDPGTIRPYFHSAAPLHRTMIQTGVVGADLFEGEADEQFVGKSGSQMYESSSSRSRTTSMGAGASFGIGGFSVGGSVRNTSTDVSGQRGVSQFVDTTQRQASEERRQLISHLMKVENVLTLLNAKYVGTPHLRFSLSPQPLQLLSVDPSDPNIWFSQLLQRRSSGIEGIQEFTTVVMVPKGEDFCVNARLQRVCVLDNPPGPLTYNERFNLTPQHLGRLLNYLDRIYPQGTPLEELDIDITGDLAPEDFSRPVLVNWVVTGNLLIVADVASADIEMSGVDEVFVVNHKLVKYKHMLEIWLETLRDEYEREVARSPLERGVLLGEHRVLDTCFSFAEAGGVVVSGSSTSVSPLFPVRIDPSDIDLGGISSTASSRRISARERAFEEITRWNLLESRMAIVLANRTKIPRSKLRFDDEQIVRLLIDRWAKLSPEDPHNLPFEEVIRVMHLNDDHRRLLKAAAATDLRSIAQVTKIAPEIDRYNAKVVELNKIYKARESKGPLKPIQFSISPKDGADILEAIGKALQNSMSDKSTEE